MQVPSSRPPDSVSISIDDFRRCDLSVSNDFGAWYYTWGIRFGERGATAFQAGDLPLSRCYWVLADACSLQLHPDNCNEPLQPGSIDEKGLPRGLSALAAHVPILGEAYAEFESPLLRARLAEVCWLLRRPKRQLNDALAAIGAYVQTPIDPDTWFEEGSEQRWRRAARLAMQLRAPGEKHLKLIADALSGIVHKELAPGAETKVALSVSRILTVLPAELTNLEAIAALLVARAEEYRRKRDWHFAELHLKQAREFFRDGDSAADAAVLLAEVHTAEAEGRKEGNSPSYMAAADFYNDAIQVLTTIPKAYRQARGVAERLAQLHVLMREAQLKSVDEFAVVRTPPVDISKEVKASADAVAGLGAVEAVVELATILSGASKERARTEAVESLQKHSFSRLFATKHVASDGRTVRKTSPAGDLVDTSSANETVFTKMVQDHQFRIRLVVPCTIVPAWQQIVLEHFIEEQDLYDICARSSVVPHGRQWIIAKGLKAGFDGDFTVALHLLVPQLEHIVRTQLGLAGVKTVTVDDGISMENGLSTLVKLPDTERIFGPDFTFELRALFCEQAGPNLRNDLAHGLLGPGETAGAASVYAWWFMLRLVVLYDLADAAR